MRETPPLCQHDGIINCPALITVQGIARMSKRNTWLCLVTFNTLWTIGGLAITNTFVINYSTTTGFFHPNFTGMCKGTRSSLVQA